MITTKKLEIHFGQVMADILEKLESNTIYFKILPGIKATTLEIETDRNSILLQPNRPVIWGKRKAKYLKRKIFGVYEGVTIDQIVDYMSNNKVDYKKIMVTPESFKKSPASRRNLRHQYLYRIFFCYLMSVIKPLKM